MIRSNLATRPFYNQRAVQLALLILSLVVAAATAANVIRIAQLSSGDTRMATEASRDETAASTLQRRAARLRASVDVQALAAASVDARRANDLIERRTFSWTELFNRFETTLPDDVRFMDVRPTLDRKRGIVLTVLVAAKSVDDVNQFIDNLQATGAFAQLEKRGESVDARNQLSATLEGVYTPSATQGGGRGDR